MDHLKEFLPEAKDTTEFVANTRQIAEHGETLPCMEAMAAMLGRAFAQRDAEYISACWESLLQLHIHSPAIEFFLDTMQVFLQDCAEHSFDGSRLLASPDGEQAEHLPENIRQWNDEHWKAAAARLGHAFSYRKSQLLIPFQDQKPENTRLHALSTLCSAFGAHSEYLRSDTGALALLKKQQAHTRSLLAKIEAGKILTTSQLAVPPSKDLPLSLYAAPEDWHAAVDKRVSKQKELMENAIKAALERGEPVFTIDIGKRLAHRRFVELWIAGLLEWDDLGAMGYNERGKALLDQVAAESLLPDVTDGKSHMTPPANR